MNSSSQMLLSALVVVLLCALLQCFASTTLQPEARLVRLIHKISTPTNSTNLDACKALKPQTKVSYPLATTYATTVSHYMTSSSQDPTCVFVPTLASELSEAIKMIGKKRIQFAVSSGKHASNQGFSSTTGIHISMKGFQKVELSSNKSYVDVGPGNVWDNVYSILNGTGVNVLGARVTGIGVGGFITGGGGFNWKTNQYGLSVDSLIQADMVLPSGKLVTASASSCPDLFFAIKGGGNQFGIIYNFRLPTYPQTDVIFGGVRTYTSDQKPALVKAINKFASTNTDPKAQIIPTVNTILGTTIVSLLGYYDGPLPGNAFSAFDGISALTNGFKKQDFPTFVANTLSNVTANQRGAFHTISLQKFSEPLIQQFFNQSHHWGTRLLKSGTFFSFGMDPFLSNYSNSANDNGGSAWPHNNSALPIDLYFAWTNPSDDDFYHKALQTTTKLLTDQATAEGQNLSSLTLYPNYAMAGITTADQLYGSTNAATLRTTKAKYDPENIMGLTTFFSFT